MSYITSPQFDPKAPQQVQSNPTRIKSSQNPSIGRENVTAVSQTSTASRPAHDSSEIIELMNEDWSRNRLIAKRDASLYCFRCHRTEKHAVVNRNRWFYSIMVGFTFGLILMIGPFRCRCCGALRWLRSDILHPKKWIR